MQTVTQSRQSISRRQGSAMTGLYRRLALGRLEGVDAGRLTVRDAWGVSEIGNPEADAVEIVVEDMSFYRDLVFRGSLGAASGFMDGKWRCHDLAGAFRLFTKNAARVDGIDHGLARLSARLEAARHWWRRNTRRGSRRNIGEHYDLGNDLFELFLDETMTYSSGIYPRSGSSLHEASVNKLDVICRKLQLQPGDRVLEIGGGWGSFAIHAASQYGCRVTTTTISDAQYELAAKRIAERGLQEHIELLKADYRDLSGAYDKLVSIEMLEAVGHDNLGAYFRACSGHLNDDGLMLIQVISMPEQRYDQYLRNSDFIQRYVFPGSCCPALSAMLGAVKTCTDMKLIGLEDIAAHYARTLRDWRHNFEARVDDVRALGYPERFIRMWRYYLSYCEAGFGERYLSNYQLLLAKPAHRSGFSGHVD
jgi:cyclopropane-fatty-acyl-phospholipid synthase